MNSNEFIEISIETHLFFLRIMKEHAYFLSISIPGKNKTLVEEAKSLNKTFNDLLHKTLSYVTNQTPINNSAVTQYTLVAEKLTEFLTGAPIDTNLTSYEFTLYQQSRAQTPDLVSKIQELNQEASKALKEIIAYKEKIIHEVGSCKLFTTIYPLQLKHIKNEALYYQTILNEIIKIEIVNTQNQILKKAAFWDIIMAQHAEFIRGLLDPTEVKLMKEANQFSRAFKDLESSIENEPYQNIINNSVVLTSQIENYKKNLTHGLINCEVKGIISPLLMDHVLREAYYYSILLNQYKK